MQHIQSFLNTAFLFHLLSAVSFYCTDQQIFWPEPQPTIYTANCLNSNPKPILEIKAKVDGRFLKNGTNKISIAVIDRVNYFLDSDSINVERAEIIVEAKEN
jgi:hypothetical protein